MAEVIIIVTRPFYESRLNWVADPAPPASRRLDDRTSPAPAPAIPTLPAEVHPRLPGRLRSRRRRRRKAAASANRNSASHPADLATPPTRPANDNSSRWASSVATRPRSTANDLPGIQPGTRSTSVEHPCSFASSPLSQHPIPATSRNSDRPFCQDYSEIWGLYKPAQIYHSQDLTATRLRDNISGFGLSSPALQQPPTKPFSGPPSRYCMAGPYREAREAGQQRPGLLYPLLPRAARPDTRLEVDAPFLKQQLWTGDLTHPRCWISRTLDRQKENPSQDPRSHADHAHPGAFLTSDAGIAPLGSVGPSSAPHHEATGVINLRLV